jgi:hypothetical protein
LAAHGITFQPIQIVAEPGPHGLQARVVQRPLPVQEIHRVQEIALHHHGHLNNPVPRSLVLSGDELGEP